MTSNQASNQTSDKDAGIDNQESPDASSLPASEPPVHEEALKEDVLADAEPREIPLLPAGEGELKLMAIAWSDEPTNRMAVINGEIIREGGSIGGAHIEKINEDDIIVRKDNRIYRLVFKLK